MSAPFSAGRLPASTFPRTAIQESDKRLRIWGRPVGDAGYVEQIADDFSLSVPRRRRRWPRRILVFLAVVFLVVTDGSLVFDAATSPRAPVPQGLTYLQAGNVRTRYREWGDTGSPVVLVHGFVESADTWQDVGTRLAAAGHRVYALDLVGWGYSQHVPPYDLQHQAKQVIAFIRVLHLDRPALVGHSSGAAIIAQAALDAPAAVGGLLFLDGDGLATGAGSQNPLTALMMYPYRTALMRLLVRSDWFIKTVYGVACGPKCAPLDAAGVEQWRRPLEIPGAEEAIWSMVRLGVPGLPTAQLARLRSLPFPKLVVFGGADSTYSKADPFETATLIGAPPPEIIRGAAHLTPVNSPDQVVAAIEELAAKNSRQTSSDIASRNSATACIAPTRPSAGRPRLAT